MDHEIKCFNKEIPAVLSIRGLIFEILLANIIFLHLVI